MRGPAPCLGTWGIAGLASVTSASGQSRAGRLSGSGASLAPVRHPYNDQSIYGRRLADVRRLLGLAEEALPGLMRVDLETNYRCPAPVLERSVRLIEHNFERFAKVIRARVGAEGRLVLAGSAADDIDRIEAVLGSWPTDGGTRAVLARTNRELLPAAVAALRLGIPFNAPDLVLPIESDLVDRLLTRAADRASRRPGTPLLPRLDAIRPRASGARGSHDADDDNADGEAAFTEAEIADTLIGWAAGFDDLVALAGAVTAGRVQLAALRRDDAALTLATAHGTKGLEFDHVAVTGLDAGRFPSARSIADAVEPERALEEERRLAYVAWTRGRRSLTLIYDPGAPSPFLLEAFTTEELGVETSNTWDRRAHRPSVGGKLRPANPGGRGSQAAAEAYSVTSSGRRIGRWRGGRRR
jgi:hypothetical protein